MIEWVQIVNVVLIEGRNLITVAISSCFCLAAVRSKDLLLQATYATQGLQCATMLHDFERVLDSVLPFQYFSRYIDRITDQALSVTEPTQQPAISLGYLEIYIKLTIWRAKLRFIRELENKQESGISDQQTLHRIEVIQSQVTDLVTYIERLVEQNQFSFQAIILPSKEKDDSLTKLGYTTTPFYYVQYAIVYSYHNLSEHQHVGLLNKTSINDLFLTLQRYTFAQLKKLYMTQFMESPLFAQLIRDLNYSVLEIRLLKAADILPTIESPSSLNNLTHGEESEHSK